HGLPPDLVAHVLGLRLGRAAAPRVRRPAELRHGPHALALPRALLQRAGAQRRLLRPDLPDPDDPRPLRRGALGAQAARLRVLPSVVLPAPHALARGRGLPVADAAEPQLGRAAAGPAAPGPGRLGPAVAGPERHGARERDPRERLGVARLPDPRLRGGDTGDPSGVRGGGRRRRRRRLAALQARHLPAAAAEPRDGHDPDVHLGLQRLRARLRHAGAIGRARLRHRPPGDVLLPHGLRRPDHRRGARPDRHRRGHRRADAADHRRGLRLRRALHDAQPDGVLMLGAGAGQSAWRRVVVYVVLGLLAVVFLFPIVLMVLTAFKTTPEIFRNPFGLPQEWTTQGFRTAWSRASFGLYLRNSLLITGSSAVLLLLTAAPAAYALARYTFRLRGVLFLFFLA